MKASIIPAQITTVEDRIAANLNFTQLLLLSIPLFLSALVFFVFPPIGKYSLYKLIIAVISTSFISVLAIRVKDKLLIDILRQRTKYYLRPRIYIYTRQSTIAQEEEIAARPNIKVNAKKSLATPSTQLSLKARISSQKLLQNRKYIVAFQSKEGGLVVKVSSS